MDAAAAAAAEQLQHPEAAAVVIRENQVAQKKPLDSPRAAAVVARGVADSRPERTDARPARASGQPMPRARVMSPDPRTAYIARMQCYGPVTMKQNEDEPVCAQGPAPQTTETNESTETSANTSGGTVYGRASIPARARMHEGWISAVTDVIPEALRARCAQLQGQAPHTRLSREYWRRYATPWHVKIIDTGFEPYVQGGLWKLASPIQHSKPTAQLQAAITEAVTEGKLERTAVESLKGTFRVRTTPKKTGGVRLISNMRPQNKRIEAPRFQMEDLRDVEFLVVSSIVRGNPLRYACVVDIKDAFQHVKLSERVRPFLGCVVNGQGYTPTSLPFGMNCSPVTWERFIEVIVHRLRARGVHLANHVDDLVVLGTTQRQAESHALQLLEELLNAGVCPNLAKSQLGGRQVFEYLGFVIDLREIPSIHVPTEKAAAVRQDLRRLARAESTTPRRVASVLGAYRALKPARKQALLDSAELATFLATIVPRGWDNPRPIPSAISQHLHELALKLDQPMSQPIDLPLPTTTTAKVATDASDDRWGAVWQRAPHQPDISFGGYFPRNILRGHITLKEAVAAKFGLHALRNEIPRQSRVVLTVDAQALFFALRRWKTKSPRLLPIIREIWAICQDMQWQLVPKWVPSEQNPADKPSREPRDHGDYRLRPSLLRKVCREFQCLPTIDLMATHQNAQFHRFISAQHQPCATAVNVFSQPLSSLPDNVLYCNPPWGLIPHLLLHLRTMRRTQRAIVVLPEWQNQTWFPHLQAISANYLVYPPLAGMYTDPWSRPMPAPRWSTRCSLICR